MALDASSLRKIVYKTVEDTADLGTGVTQAKLVEFSGDFAADIFVAAGDYKFSVEISSEGRYSLSMIDFGTGTDKFYVAADETSVYIKRTNSSDVATDIGEITVRKGIRFGEIEDAAIASDSTSGLTWVQVDKTYSTQLESLTVDGASSLANVYVGSTITGYTGSFTNNLNVGGNLSVVGSSTLTGDLAVNGGDITTTSTTLNIGYTGSNAQTINIGNVQAGSAQSSTLNLGYTGSISEGYNTQAINIGNNVATVNIPGNLVVAGTTTYAGSASYRNIVVDGDLTSATFPLEIRDTNPAQTVFSVGYNGSTYIRGDLQVVGTSALAAVTGTTGSFSGNVNAANIYVGSAITGYTGSFTNNVNVGAVLTVNSTTDSSSKDTGAVIVEGGVGIEKRLYVGSSASVGGDLEVAGSSTLAGDLAVNGGDITTSSQTLNFGYTGSLFSTTNIANASGYIGSKTINIGTAAGSSRTDVNIGYTGSGTTTINSPLAIVSGSLNVTGDLTISGSTTTINTTELLVSDSTVTLNSGYTGTNPSVNAGIEVERGDPNNSSIIWNEGSDKWQFNDGSATYDFVKAGDIKDTEITIAGGTDLEINTSGGANGVFSLNQSTAETITIDHSDVARTSYTGSTASPAFGGTFTAIDSITTSSTGHVTETNLKTVTIPTPADGILDWSTDRYSAYASGTADLAWVSDNANAGKFYLGTEAPSKTTRLNYNGNLWATTLYSGGYEVLTTNDIGAAATITLDNVTTSGSTTTNSITIGSLTVSGGNAYVGSTVFGYNGSFANNLRVAGTSTLAAVTGTTGSFSGAVTSFNSYVGSTVFGYNGSFANNLNVGGTSAFTGNSTFAGDIAVNGGDVFLPSTGAIGYYGSAAAQTLNIATFAATAGNSKTINIGTGNTSAATNVNIGYTGSGTTTINSPTTLISNDLTVSGDANFEWQLVGATDNFTDAEFTISGGSGGNIYTANGVKAPSSFNTNDYDYKFVYYAACNTEESGSGINDSTAIKLRVNGIEAQKRYAWVAQRIVRGDAGLGDNTFEDTDGTSGDSADDRTSRIHTITILDDISNASSNGQTFVKLEFTISESYAPSGTSGVLMIEGEGNAIFSTTSSSVTFKSGTSKAWFTGTVSGTTSLTSVTFLDTIGATTTSVEFQKVQVYRRKRLTFTPTP